MKFDPKNMSKAQTRSLISLGSAAFGISSAYRDLRKARGTKDKLALVDAVLSLAVVLTGLALAVRALRRDESS